MMIDSKDQTHIPLHITSVMKRIKPIAWMSWPKQPSSRPSSFVGLEERYSHTDCDLNFDDEDGDPTSL